MSRESRVVSPVSGVLTSMLKQIVLCWDDHPMLEPRVPTRANATSKSVGAGSYVGSHDSSIPTPESRL